MNENLDPNDILIAEFNYAAQSAFQANEDRLKVFNLFIANVGTLIAAIIIPQQNSQISYYYFSLIFIFLSVIGVLVLLQLAKLRIAWVGSVQTMNHVKDYYINNFPGLEKAFRWRQSNIPKASKGFTIAFLLAIMTILVNSLGISAALAFIQLESLKEVYILPIIVVTTISIVAQLKIWFNLTGRN